jgi:fructosamine-3-kinase
VSAEAIAAALGVERVRLSGLSGGCVGEVYAVETSEGERLVAKVDQSAGGALDVEGYMLDYLGQHSALPVPAVRHADPSLLVMEWLPGSSGGGGAEDHAAGLLADLHGVQAEKFGLQRATLIGGLHQPNPQVGSWVEFFAEHRLLEMAGQAFAAGRLDQGTMGQVEALAGRVEKWLAEPDAPSLLHGDVWSGNVLSEGKKVTGFVDPAIYYGHPEVELAFITLFSTFGKRFFAVYGERRGIAAGFWEERRDLYNLYPLLVHVRLFGGGYVGQVQGILRRFL